MEDKCIVLVDVFDNKVGMSTKQEVHRAGKLHRAFSVFLYHRDMMFLQKRAINKYHSGGLWSNACCSHPPDNVVLAEFARKRVYEEIQVECPVEEVFQFIYFHKFDDELFEYEYDHVFIGEYEGDFYLNTEETIDAKWVSFKELAALIKEQPQLFSVWFLAAAPKVMEIILGRKNKIPGEKVICPEPPI